ncbi:MAG: 2-phosphosulfolactate phosphatase [Clostridiaceae bacterium]
MKIDVVISHEYVTNEDLENKTVIIIDTLRATSVIVTAMMNGAEEIFPVKEVEEAVIYKERLGNKEDILLGGERRGLKIQGFDLSNSPLEFTKEIVDRKTIIMTTTNGTRTMEKCSKADEIIIGSLLNGSAAGQKAVAGGRDIIIVNSGTKGIFTTDDFITAGFIINSIIESGIHTELTDIADTARMLYISNEDIHSAMEGCYHYNYLRSIGLEEDLKYCLTKDLTDIVPILKDGRISL